QVTYSILDNGQLLVPNKLDTDARYLYSGIIGGVPSVSWGTMELVDTNNITAIDWRNRFLADENNQVAINFSSGRKMVDSANVNYILWQNRLLRDNTNTSTLDWQNMQLIGGWTFPIGTLATSGTVTPVRGTTAGHVVFNCTTTGNVTINVPSSGSEGDSVRLRFKASSGT